MDNISQTQANTTLWFQVEQDIAKLLIEKLEDQEITPEHAAQIARFAVKSISTQVTDQQMLNIIPKLDDEFTELASVVYKHLKKYEDRYKPQVEATVEELVKHGEFQKASDLMQQYFQRKL